MGWFLRWEAVRLHLWKVGLSDLKFSLKYPIEVLIEFSD